MKAEVYYFRNFLLVYQKILPEKRLFPLSLPLSLSFQPNENNSQPEHSSLFPFPLKFSLPLHLKNQTPVTSNKQNKQTAFILNYSWVQRSLSDFVQAGCKKIVLLSKIRLKKLKIYQHSLLWYHGCWNSIFRIFRKKKSKKFWMNLFLSVAAFDEISSHSFSDQIQIFERFLSPRRNK